jgi:hypothetical protein
MLPRKGKMNDHKILLCRLFEKTSERGNRYLFGRLGAARIVAFIDADAELRYGATAAFSVYIQSGDERPKVEAAPRRRAPARRRPRTEPADDGEPLPDDGVEDLWR